MAASCESICRIQSGRVTVLDLTPSLRISRVSSVGSRTAASVTSFRTTIHKADIRQARSHRLANFSAAGVTVLDLMAVTVRSTVQGGFTDGRYAWLSLMPRQGCTVDLANFTASGVRVVDFAASDRRHWRLQRRVRHGKYGLMVPSQRSGNFYFRVVRLQLEEARAPVGRRLQGDGQTKSGSSCPQSAPRSRCRFRVAGPRGRGAARSLLSIDQNRLR